jgi:hypothetical protein
MQQGLLLRLCDQTEVRNNGARGARELLLIPNDVPGDHNALIAWIPELPALEVLRITQEQARQRLGLKALLLITTDMGVGTASKDT